MEAGRRAGGTRTDKCELAERRLLQTAPGGISRMSGGVGRRRKNTGAKHLCALFARTHTQKHTRTAYAPCPHFLSRVHDLHLQKALVKNE